MMTFYTTQGREIKLGGEIGRGGEGTVSEVVGEPGVVAKIYSTIPVRYKEKLIAMQHDPPIALNVSNDHKAIAWPTDLIFDRKRQFVGYLMPYVRDSESLLTVYSPMLRKRRLPNFDQRYRYRTAHNLAAAVEAVHEAGYVIGDLNESNVRVTPTAGVTLIDCDSFQVTVKHDGQIVTMPCPVGKEEYTPPELHGKDFKGEIRSPEQDCFALAVLIFLILMDGNHPFLRSQWLGQGDPPEIKERIMKGLYPYNPQHAHLVRPWPQVPYESLRSDLQMLFWRSFVDGHAIPAHRPKAAEWRQVLAAAEITFGQNVPPPIGLGQYLSPLIDITHGQPAPAMYYDPSYIDMSHYRSPSRSRRKILAIVGGSLAAVSGIWFFGGRGQGFLPSVASTSTPVAGTRISPSASATNTMAPSPTSVPLETSTVSPTLKPVSQLQGVIWTDPSHHVTLAYPTTWTKASTFEMAPQLLELDSGDGVYFIVYGSVSSDTAVSGLIGYRDRQNKRTDRRCLTSIRTAHDDN